MDKAGKQRSLKSYYYVDIAKYEEIEYSPKKLTIMLPVRYTDANAPTDDKRPRIRNGLQLRGSVLAHN
jgi:hypothetical protein